jgi:hypothetical protein
LKGLEAVRKKKRETHPQSRLAIEASAEDAELNLEITL